LLSDLFFFVRISAASMLYIKNLSYHPTAAQNPILKQINLELGPQEMGLIIGRSGSGKSTLLEIMSGLATPTSGDLHWRRQELTPITLQQLAGLVFQFPERHFCGGTILEELRLGHPEISTDQVYQALQEVGLGQLSLYTSPQSLSGGQQRRLALAVQLIRQPHLLLLDEPTAGLDWSMRQQLVTVLQKLKQQRSLLAVTHEPAELVAIADRCWLIQDGQVEPITPQELSQRLSVNALDPFQRAEA
jgi:energy-coupling factor transport system ATP-binding protein